MRLVRRLAVTPFLAALALLWANAAPAQQIEWSRWYAGAGLGLGINAHYRQSGDTRNFDEGAMQGATDKSGLGAFNLEGGLRLDAKTLVGLAFSAVAKSGKVNDETVSTSVGNFLATVTYFPAERGFFLRAGAGYARITLDTGVDTTHAGGIGVLGGLGYSWNLLTNHYLTAAIEQSFQFYHSNQNDRPTRSEFSAFYVGYMYRH